MPLLGSNFACHQNRLVEPRAKVAGRHQLAVAASRCKHPIRRPGVRRLSDTPTGAGKLLPPPRALRQFLRPADDVVLEILVRHGLFAGAQAAPYRDSGRMHGLGVSGDERMPPIEVPALGNEHIGAGRRQPIDGFEALRRQSHAVMHLFEPIPIVAAAAGLAVEEPAADIGVIGVGVVALLLELIEAASAAAVAEAFPFRISHFFQRLAPPEWDIVRAVSRHCHVILRATQPMPNLPAISIHPAMTGGLVTDWRPTQPTSSRPVSTNLWPAKSRSAKRAVLVVPADFRSERQ